VKQDPKQALALVNDGADPNTPFDPPSSPSLKLLWNHLVHHTTVWRKDNYSAFHIACGAFVHTEDVTIRLNTDEPRLVETMLQHGAQKNAKDADGFTPLIWSVMFTHFKTVDVLLEHGVDVNAQDQTGNTALINAISPTADPSERSKSATLVRKLLAHRADPNLPNRFGATPLHVAHGENRPDLVALLKQAGAKK